MNFKQISDRKNFIKNFIKKKYSNAEIFENVIKNVYLRISNCSRAFLFICGDLRTVYFCTTVGNVAILHFVLKIDRS